jgi:serine/threonine protein kinase
MAIYDDINGQLLGRRYRVHGKLGQGAFGVVFRATHEVLGTGREPGLPFRDVALKILLDKFVTRSNAAAVFNEAVMLEKLASTARSRGEHPHIVGVYDIGVFEDYHYLPYVAMELVDGGSLDREIRVGAPLTRAVELLRQICAGVKLAHDAGIYHRDLKPGNVLFTTQGFLKVSDFGLAIDRYNAFLQHGDARAISYGAPDTAAIASGAFDIYSLGIVLLEFILQRNPIEIALEKVRDSSNARSAALRAAQEGLASLLDPETRQPLAHSVQQLRWDSGLQDILRKCLALYPEDRYQHAGELDAALEQWQKRMSKPSVERRRSLQEILDAAHRLLRGGQRYDLARAEIDEAQRLAVSRQQQGQVAAAWSAFFEAKGSFREAAAKQQEYLNALAPARPSDALRRLAALHGKAGDFGAELALQREMKRAARQR